MDKVDLYRTALDVTPAYVALCAETRDNRKTGFLQDVNIYFSPIYKLEKARKNAIFGTKIEQTR